MVRSRVAWLSGIVLVLVATEAAPARADMPAGPWPWSKRASPSRNRHLHESPPGAISAPDPAPPPVLYPDDPIPKSKRTGPFRSCGSGTPTALAGIGAVWAMLWFGIRFARSTRSPDSRPRSTRG